MAILSWLYKRSGSSSSSDESDDHKKNKNDEHDDSLVVAYDTDTDSNTTTTFTTSNNKKNSGNSSRTRQSTTTTSTITLTSLPHQKELQSYYFSNTDITRSLKKLNYLSLEKDNSNTPIECVCSFDTTGRMFKYFQEFRSNASTTLESLFQTIPLLKIAFIVHGDYCDDIIQQQSSTTSPRSATTNTKLNRAISILSFTNDRMEILKWLEKVDKTDGGDAPENYELVLRKSRELPWSENSNKALFIFGDDVPHPPSYTNQHFYWRNELYYLSKIGVRVYGIQCQNNKHAQLFYEELAGLSGGRYIHLTETKYIAQLFILLCLRENGKIFLDGYIEQEGGNQIYQSMFPQLWQDTFIRERDTVNVRFAWWDISNDIDPNPKYLWNDETCLFELNESLNYVIPPPPQLSSPSSPTLIYQQQPLQQQPQQQNQQHTSPYISRSPPPAPKLFPPGSKYTSSFLNINYYASPSNSTSIYSSSLPVNYNQAIVNNPHHNYYISPATPHSSVSSIFSPTSTTFSPFSLANHLPTASRLNFASNKQATIGSSPASLLKKRKPSDEDPNNSSLKYFAHYHPYSRPYNSSSSSSPSPSISPRERSDGNHGEGSRSKPSKSLSNTPSTSSTSTTSTNLGKDKNDLIWLEKPLPRRDEIAKHGSLVGEENMKINNNLYPTFQNQQETISNKNVNNEQNEMKSLKGISDVNGKENGKKLNGMNGITSTSKSTTTIIEEHEQYQELTSSSISTTSSSISSSNEYPIMGHMIVNMEVDSTSLPGLAQS